MSIFPKRTVAGSTVTIHWNLTLPAGTLSSICPYVRIGINTPGGQTHMLLDEHILLLPSTAAPASPAMQQTGTLMYLNKQTPLLIVASYLAGKQPREKLVELLTNIQNGRHYYFTWSVPPGAAPGKYTLLSEMYIDGMLKQSGTAADDFFYVEQLDIVGQQDGTVTVFNPGPESVPAKLITWVPGIQQHPESLEVFYIDAGKSYVTDTSGRCVFLVYNEERITVPLHSRQLPRSLRNQQYHAIHKEEGGEKVTYVMPRTGEEGWRLTGVQQAIYAAANGIVCAQTLRATGSLAYEELLSHRLIIELP